jgi:hypothetical protein
MGMSVSEIIQELKSAIDSDRTDVICAVTAELPKSKIGQEAQQN